MVIVAFKPNKKEYSYDNELFQYDYGQILRIQGLQLPAAVEVHFSAHSTDGTTITRLGTTKDGVTDVPIPDSLLENEYNMGDYKIYAFIYLTDATSGQTEYKITLPVKARPRPEVPAGVEDPDLFRDVVETVKEFAESASQSQKLVRADKESIDKTVQEFALSSQQALANVNNAGQTQTQRVQTEGEKQVEEIENKGAEILQDCKEAGAPPIIQTATGNPIIVQDSAERRVQGLRVFGKTTQVQTTGAQLLDTSAFSATSGVTLEVLENGRIIKINGRGSYAQAGITFKNKLNGMKLFLIADKIERFNDTSESKVSAQIIVKKSDGVTDFLSLHPTHLQESVTVPDDALECSIRVITNNTGNILSNPVKVVITGLRLVTEGHETKPYEPYTGGKPSPSPDYPQALKTAGGDGEIENVVHGAQLFDASRIPTKKDGGVTVTNNEDGSFTVSGANKITATYENQIILTNEETKRILHEGIVRLKEKTNIYPMFMCGLCPADANSFISNKRLDINNNSFEITKNDLQSNRLRYVFYGNVNDTIIPGTIKPMLYQDGDGTWEPYKPPQTLIFPTQNGLPGIPVSSGGNYTDSTGQQWICDYVNLNTGRIIKCIEHFSLEGRTFTLNKEKNNTFQFTNTFNKLIKNNLMCDRFKSLGGDSDEEGIWIYNNITIVVQINKSRGISTPEELKTFFKNNKTTICVERKDADYTTIPQETLTAYKKLHSNYPSTVVQNTEGAGMELEYIADTKTYLDNIKKEFMEAIANTNAQLLQEVTHVRKY